ncbi:endonuclease-reverse transcriptase [Plakobranchus ocellatus]|uniref:Endonuclease-reverse transcriptase n=1 Tax=Plakobranchus ocellatus TaxID=259542 RepID=A0AAV4E172_9GAST|nr:endonuclease-reverse transcriptase [Plakobranchus ocellatus]
MGDIMRHTLGNGFGWPAKLSGTPRATRAIYCAGEGTLRARKTPGHDEVSSNPSGRPASDTGAQNYTVEGSSKRNKKKRKKRTTNIGTWNVQTLKEVGKLGLLTRELEHQDVNITGLCEVRWQGCGHFTSGDHLIVYSGGKGGQAGVAIVLDKQTKGSLVSYGAVSDRILVVHLHTKPVKTTIIQVYAPTMQYNEEEKELFYNQLQAVMDTIKTRNMTIVMGDFNAKVGEGQEKKKGLGSHGLGERNVNGEYLLNFSEANNLMVLNTWFKCHQRRKYTWISPNGETKNQIDFIMVNKQWFSSFSNCVTKPGADCDTDQILLTAKLKLKGFKKKVTEIPLIRYDLARLHDTEVLNKYLIETENRFEILLKTDEEKSPDDLRTDMKEIWNQTAESLLGRKKISKGKPWISEKTKELADRKRKAREEGDKPEYQRLKADVKKQSQLERKTNRWGNPCGTSSQETFVRINKEKKTFLLWPRL